MTTHKMDVSLIKKLHTAYQSISVLDIAGRQGIVDEFESYADLLNRNQYYVAKRIFWDGFYK